MHALMHAHVHSDVHLHMHATRCTSCQAPEDFIQKKADSLVARAQREYLDGVRRREQREAAQVYRMKPVYVYFIQRTSMA